MITNGTRDLIGHDVRHTSVKYLRPPPQHSPVSVAIFQMSSPFREAYKGVGGDGGIAWQYLRERVAKTMIDVATESFGGQPSVKHTEFIHIQTPNGLGFGFNIPSSSNLHCVVCPMHQHLPQIPPKIEGF